MIDPNERPQFVARAWAALWSQCWRWTLFQNAIMIRGALNYLAAASTFLAEGEDAVMRTTLITAAEGFHVFPLSMDSVS